MASDPFRSIVLKLTNLACRMEMHATTGNGIQILDEYNFHIAFHFDGAPHPQSLSFFMAHLSLLYAMIFSDCLICLIFCA